MAGNHRADTDTARAASLLDPLARAATFTALRPALEALAAEAGTDTRLSPDARRVLRAAARTRPVDTLALADLAARSSTPKTRVPAALNELDARGYLARLTRIAPHLAAALPARTCPTRPTTVPSESHNQTDS